MWWRKTKDEDRLDCQSPAWLGGYEDAQAGRPPDEGRDGGARPRLSSEQRDYRDGYSTGESEREWDVEDE